MQPNASPIVMVDVLDRPDIQASRRLRGEDQPGVARQVHRLQVSRWRPHVDLDSKTRCLLVDERPPHLQAGREPVVIVRIHDHTLGNGKARDQAKTLLVLEDF
jgi:hypothetical protein